MEQGLDTIERNARIQTRLIEDLLDMSRIISGKLRLDVQRLHPLACIEAAIETVQPSAEAKGIRLERMLDPQAGPIAGDPNRLQQIVWNLLSNAVKFTPRGGKVQVLLQRINSHIEITVADTGQGIRPEFLSVSCSIDFVRPMPRPPAGTADWGSAFQSSSNWSSCTEELCGSTVRAKARARRLSSLYRSARSIRATMANGCIPPARTARRPSRPMST